MKMSVVDTIQHISVIAIFAFCVSYSYFSSGLNDIILMVFLWVSAVIFLYIPNLLISARFSGRDLEDTKKISILGSWTWVTWSLYRYSKDELLMSLCIVLFIVFIVASVFYQIQFRKRHAGNEKRNEQAADYQKAKREWRRFMLFASFLVVAYIIATPMLFRFYWHVEILWYIWYILAVTGGLLFLIIARRKIHIP